MRSAIDFRGYLRLLTGMRDRFGDFLARIGIFACLFAVPGANGREGDAGEQVELPPLAVSASRDFPHDSRVSLLSRSWASDEIAVADAPTVDLILSREPSFSLYRRQDGRFANPTTQGANLRTLGATAASRTLVLRDGIPQNDPFGGWIPWARFQADALASIEILPAARATVWGNASAAGVIHLRTHEPSAEVSQITGVAGDRGTRGVSVSHREPGQEVDVALGARWWRSTGDYLVHAADRGPIDQRADLDLKSFDLSVHWRPREHRSVSPAFSWFEEERGNGTPLARNRTRGWDLSLRSIERFGNASLEAIAYIQDREFANLFTAVGDNRESENRVLDQFEIRGKGTGGSVIGGWRMPNDWHLLGGIDARLLEGITHEDFGFGLSNRRIAGGEQSFYGVFAKAGVVAQSHAIEVAARLDRWAARDGSRRETVLSTGQVLVQEHFDNRSGYQPSASIRASWHPAARWSVQGALSHAFRFPTVNELYRPYRVGSDVFVANADLDPEVFSTAEGSVEHQFAEGWTIGIGIFHTWIREAVANVFIADGPLESPGGFVPAGGTYNRRENVDRARVFGVPIRLEGRLSDRLSGRIDFLWTEARFHRSTVQPGLENRRFPQSPDYRWGANLEYILREHWVLDLGAEGSGRQFDDPLNTRRLSAYTRWQIGLRWQAREQVGVQLRFDNVRDETVVTGVSGDGIRSVAPGRSISLSVRWQL